MAYQTTMYDQEAPIAQVWGVQLLGGDEEEEAQGCHRGAGRCGGEILPQDFVAFVALSADLREMTSKMEQVKYV